MKPFLTFVSVVIAFSFICLANSHLLSRRKRGAYDMPDGWNELRSTITPSFECQENGYFADVDNECQLFHVCQFIQLPFSKPRFLHYTFICGNGTVFNQLTQTCTMESQLSVPCQSSPQLFYMNKRIGELNQWFHSSEDFEKIKVVNNDNRFNSILTNAQNPVFRPSTATNSLDDGFDDDDFR